MKSYWIVTRDHVATMEKRDMPVPQPKAGELLIKVAASAMNRGEIFVGGVMHGGPEKLGGNEGSGVVEAVGEGVTEFKKGDRVMGRCRGAFAEYAIMEVAQAMKVPAHLSMEEAAATPLSFITAYEMVVQYGKLKAGEWLFVPGASSGAGVCSIQIAQVLGAKTIGTSGSAEKLQKLKSIGLDVGIRTRQPDFADKVKEATGGKGANLALNLVGGTFFPEILKCLANQGRVAIVGYVDNSHHAEIDLSAVHANRFQIFGVSNARLTTAEKAAAAAGFKRDILPAIDSGKIKPLVDSVFSLDDIAQAKERMESNAMTGKIVVKVA
ncbi:MAG TPA: zinc-binding dehydrogenase [Burkholderiales bacterium]|nr:zinc-binding dehydrogenase [Burkholderiales bacterium]